MSSAQIKELIQAKNDEMRAAYVKLSDWHREKANEISAAYGNEVSELRMKLRRVEQEEAYQAERLAQEADWLDGDEEAEAPGGAGPGTRHLFMHVSLSRL